MIAASSVETKGDNKPVPPSASENLSSKYISRSCPILVNSKMGKLNRKICANSL